MPSLLADIFYLAIAGAAIARVGAALNFELYDRLIPVARWSWAVAFLGYVLFTLRGAIWPPSATKV